MTTCAWSRPTGPSIAPSKASQAETRGTAVRTGQPPVGHPELRQCWKKSCPRTPLSTTLKSPTSFEQIGRRTMLLNARRISGEAGQTGLILLAIEDITRAPASRGDEAVTAQEIASWVPRMPEQRTLRSQPT